MDDAARAALIAHFAGWVPMESRVANPTYTTLCEGVISSEALLALAAQVASPQLPANVLFASVHFLLLQGADHRLKYFYATVCERFGLELTTSTPGRLVEAFTDFTTAYEHQLVELLHSGITQTNEVARSAILACVLGDLAAEGTDMVALLDAGCSAGLNCFVDHYSIGHALHCTTGPANSKVVLQPTHQGRLPHPVLPCILERVGLDQHPLDPADPRNAAWLEACLWPDDPSRFTRLSAALELAKANRHLLRLEMGDLLLDVARVAESLSANHHLVITTSWATAYLPANTHLDFEALISDLGATRSMTWISFEHPTVSTALGLCAPSFRTESPGASLLVRRTFKEGESVTTIVGEAHPHGAWINLYPLMAGRAPSARALES